MSDGTVRRDGEGEGPPAGPCQLVTRLRSRRWTAWLFFAAEDSSQGRELWHSDGTPRNHRAGPGAGDGLWQLFTARSSPRSPGTLFFSAETAGHGREPWMSDGTADGTVPLREIAPGGASSNPPGFARSGWRGLLLGDGVRPRRGAVAAALALRIGVPRVYCRVTGTLTPALSRWEREGCLFRAPGCVSGRHCPSPGPSCG